MIPDSLLSIRPQGAHTFRTFSNFKSLGSPLCCLCYCLLKVRANRYPINMRPYITVLRVGIKLSNVSCNTVRSTLYNPCPAWIPCRVLGSLHFSRRSMESGQLTPRRTLLPARGQTHARFSRAVTARWERGCVDTRHMPKAPAYVEVGLPQHYCYLGEEFLR